VVVGRYSGTLKEYDRQISQMRKDLDKANLEQTRSQIARLQWIEAGAQTLSMDPNLATTQLREELEKLAETSKLAGADVSLESTPKPWQKKGIRVLNATVTGQARFEEIVNFLYELHREPFAVRVKSLTLDQASKPTKRGAKPANPGLLKMTLYVDTLILPPCDLVAQITPAALEAGRKPMSRPAEASLAGYKALLDRKLFQAYEAPAITVRTSPPPSPRGSVPSTQPQQVVQAPPPPPPPPRDAAFVLGRLLSSPRGQLAVLEDRARNGEDEYKEVGDEMYAGTLIFVHPTGAVTEKDGQLRFHAIGDQLQNCKPLTENDQPVVYEELMKLEKQATGISARPQ
jgi:hypothetical protein